MLYSVKHILQAVYGPFSPEKVFGMWAETSWRGLSAAGQCFEHRWHVLKTHRPRPLGSGPLGHSGWWEQKGYITINH